MRSLFQISILLKKLVNILYKVRKTIQKFNKAWSFFNGQESTEVKFYSWSWRIILRHFSSSKRRNNRLFYGTLIILRSRKIRSTRSIFLISAICCFQQNSQCWKLEKNFPRRLIPVVIPVWKKASIEHRIIFHTRFCHLERSKQQFFFGW